MELVLQLDHVRDDVLHVRGLEPLVDGVAADARGGLDQPREEADDEEDGVDHLLVVRLFLFVVQLRRLALLLL